MKFLLPDQAVSQLNAGRAIEQWLGHENAPNYRSIRWLRIDVERGGEFAVAVFEVFDDGGPEMLDLYSFEPVDPDLPHGLVSTFSTAEAAISASLQFGARPEEFIGAGMIQNSYAEFLQQHGLAPGSGA